MPRARRIVVLLVAFLLVVPGAAGSARSGVVVSQVFGGGGNSGAPYANDFVELFNAGSAPVDITGWTLQYATATGTSWQATPLGGTLQPGQYHLVQLASGGAVGNALPTPDSSGTTNISATSGKVAVVRDTSSLTCGASAGSCSANTLVEDLVGYGAASDYEGAGAAPGGTSTTAVVRAGGGCTDTDVNATDFLAAAPTPRNTAAATRACASDPVAPGPSQSASVDVDVQPVLSLSLERATLSFGNALAGSVPPPISERVTVLSNQPTGYSLTVHRSTFAPADLPLALQASAPAGAMLGAAFASGAFAPIPIGPSSMLTIGTTSTTSAGGGDVWPTSVGFAAPFPTVPPGRYTATVTFTVIAR